MKINESVIRRIIREETQRLMKEGADDSIMISDPKIQRFDFDNDHDWKRRQGAAHGEVSILHEV